MQKQTLIAGAIGAALGAGGMALVGAMNTRYPSMADAQQACSEWRLSAGPGGMGAYPCEVEQASRQVLGRKLECWPDSRIDFTREAVLGEDSLGNLHTEWKRLLGMPPRGCSEFRVGPVLKRFRF